MNHNGTILVRTIAQRIEEAAGVITLDLVNWERLCAHVLPEWYADRPQDPDGPTTLAPGSSEKLDLFEARIESGVDLFHVDDARLQHAPTGARGPTMRVCLSVDPIDLEGE